MLYWGTFKSEFTYPPLTLAKLAQLGRHESVLGSQVQSRLKLFCSKLRGQYKMTTLPTCVYYEKTEVQFYF